MLSGLPRSFKNNARRRSRLLGVDLKRKTHSQSDTKSPGRSFARFFIVVSWAIMAVVVTAVSLEGFLAFKWGYLRPRQRELLQQSHESTQPEFDRLSRAYHPFAVQHINPYYLFFFPFDRDERIGINNEVCSIDREGFRGPGPEEAGERKLAFIVGGSAVFGHYASSDSTTITGFLNTLQDEYFFINAGVPSWNSLQELYRLAFQILDYDPDLVIAYDGGNDIALTYLFWQEGLDFPAGTPESFDALHALVDDIRGKGLQTMVSSNTSWLFPRLSRAIRARLSSKLSETESDEIGSAAGEPAPLIRAATDRYLSNLGHMQAMTHASGARFIAIFQPIGQLHNNAPEDRRAQAFVPHFRQFRDQAFSAPDALVEHLDYSTIFERLDHTLPWLGQEASLDLSDDTVFVDGFHLYNLGNRMIAEEIIAYLHSADPGRREIALKSGALDEPPS